MAKKAVCIILSIIILIGNVIIAAAESGKFISVSFKTYNELGETVSTNEVLYTDGKQLYAPVELFEEYTAYYYDVDNYAFVRVGQQYNRALSSVTIDYGNKTAKVKMMYSEKEYNIYDIFQFGSSYYLPLDQVLAFLKAKIEIVDGGIMIQNSGYSIADAAYNFNEYQYVLDYFDIIDEIFCGNEDIYMQYCVLSYISSTIFGLRIKNLDRVFHSGDIDYYKDALAACVTDNSEYLKTQSSEDTFTERLANASSFTEGTIAVVKKLKTVTTCIKNMYETFADTNDIANLDIVYIDAKNWNEVFGKLSTAYSYMDYFVKALAMTQDHKAMLNNCVKHIDLFDDSFSTALVKTNEKFGKDFFSGITQTVADTLIDEIPANAVKKYAADAVPYIAVIKGVNAYFKLLGIDLSDNLQYSILIDSDVAYELTNMYSSLSDKSGETKAASEEFRRAGIFMLLSMKHAYESGNDLSKKTEGSESLFNPEINDVCAKLNLFYRAVESSEYDSLEGVDELLKINKEAVSSSNIISTAPTATGSQYSYALTDLIYNLPSYGFETRDTSSGIELIDLNNDSIPEVVTCSYMGATHIPSIDGVFYYDGEKYTMGTIDGGYTMGATDGGIFPIMPRKTPSSKTIFTSYLRGQEELEEYYSDSYPTISSFWYYYGGEVEKYTIENGCLKQEIMRDFSNYRDILWDSETDETSKLECWHEYVQNVIAFNNENPYDTGYQYTVIRDIPFGMISSDLSYEEQLTIYHQIMTKDFAKYIVNSYLNGVISPDTGKYISY